MNLFAILSLILKYSNVVVALAPTILGLVRGIASLLSPDSEFTPDDVVLGSWDSSEDVSDEVKMRVGELVVTKLREANAKLKDLA